MNEVITMRLPDLGEGIDFATISEIGVAVGQTIKHDDIILVLESDKASMEIPSEVSGVVKSVDVKQGQEVKTNDLLITIEVENRNETTVEKEDEKEDIKTSNTPAPSKKKKETPLINKPTSDGIYASPGVRRLARELEINLNTISGSGEKGRVTKDDLHSHIKAQMYISKTNLYQPDDNIDYKKWGSVDIKKLTKIKKITGQRLTRAWQSIPHVTQFIESDVTELEKLRKDEKTKQGPKGIKITMMPYLMKAAVFVLKEHPVFNSSLQNSGENIVYKKYYHIGVAVNTENGLVVPVIKDVDKKSVLEISQELMDVSERARNKKLAPNELKGGTFTISNLGGIGGSFFTPIINPPEVAILGVSRTKEKNEKLILPLSLSYDHRVIDGAAGAAFVVAFSNVLKDIKKFK